MPQQPQQLGQPVMVMQPQALTMQQQLAPGVICIEYLAPDCCCGQPSKRGSMTVLVDGKEVNTVGQGSRCEIPVRAGMHTVSAKEAGAGGFFKGVFGSNNAGQVMRQVQPGQRVSVTIGWRGRGAGNSGYDPYVE